MPALGGMERVLLSVWPAPEYICITSLALHRDDPARSWSGARWGFRGTEKVNLKLCNFFQECSCYVDFVILGF